MHSKKFFEEAIEILNMLDAEKVDKLASELAHLRESKGRLFILGVGGSAANASHAVNDFRKLCGIETYSPTDNVSELTARTNDEGWESVFSEWLKTSHGNAKDALLVLSVGGGNKEKNVSMNIVKALEYGKDVGMKIFGIVGRDGGETAKMANLAIIVPTVETNRVTPHAEAFQAVIWHCLVSNPVLQMIKTKW